MPRNARRKPPGMTNSSVPSAPLKVGGLGYGENQATNAAASAGFMGRDPVPTAPVGVGPDAMQAALEYSPSVTPLGAPSENPDEPVTAGLPMGAGPGPEGMQTMQAGPPPDPDIQALLPYLPTLERLASMPTASVATRNLIRRLRGAQVNA